VSGLVPGARVLPAAPVISAPQMGHTETEPVAASNTRHLPVGDELLGRVVDASGKPLDKLGGLSFRHSRPLSGPTINPIDRAAITQAMDVGVRAINGLLSVGRGQRIGLFAGSGVGKSVLLGMMAKYAKADRVVVALIGERGREVKEFIEHILGQEGLSRSVVVAAPADSTPLIRMQGAAYATSIAEHFRDQGHHVLLIMDSLTRYAMAQREIALAIGEPPATKGYPPSVFAKLPKLVERTGNGLEGGGSITAFYTVLTEGDDQQDPIADAARAILDGHIVLSRKLAEGGHYPAIDIEQSISRVMHNISTPVHMQVAMALKSAFSRVQRNRDLISVGAYVPGNDAQLDQALQMFSTIEAYLQQSMQERAEYADSVRELLSMFNAHDAMTEGVNHEHTNTADAA
jgi:flagellum-specific ATP synthase